MVNRNDWAVVVDVDGTLTHKKAGSLCNIVDNAALHADGRLELAGLRERFKPLAIAGTLSYKDELFWLKETFRIYAAYGLTRSGWESAIDAVEVREGVLEAFDWIESHGIPVAAISYGCADFVERLLARHGLKAEAVYAGRLRHVGDLMTGADVPTFVVPAFKGDRSKHFADVHDVPYDRIIAIGDSGGDKGLGHLRENRFLIAGTPDEEKMLSALGVAEVCLTESFLPALDFLRRRTGLP